MQDKQGKNKPERDSFLKQYWNRFTPFGKGLIGFILFNLTGALLATAFVTLYGLAGKGTREDAFHTGLAGFMMVASFLGAFLLLLGVNGKAYKQGQKPPSLQAVLAFFGMISLGGTGLVWLGPSLIPGMKEEAHIIQPVVYMAGISLLLMVPLAVYYVRQARPSSRPKAKGWQLALLGVGAVSLVTGVSMVVDSIVSGESLMSMAGFVLPAGISVALTLPYFLRR